MEPDIENCEDIDLTHTEEKHIDPYWVACWFIRES